MSATMIIANYSRQIQMNHEKFTSAHMDFYLM